MLLARGLDLAQASLVVAVQSVLSMALELPSGMAGDLWGRKRVWLASRVFFAAQLALYLTARGPVLFLAAALGGTPRRWPPARWTPCTTTGGSPRAAAAL